MTWWGRTNERRGSGRERLSVMSIGTTKIPRHLLRGLSVAGTLLAAGLFTSSAPDAAEAAQQLNCAPVPSKCGYPDATNTGLVTKIKVTKRVKIKKKKRVIKRKKLRGKKRFRFVKRHRFESVPFQTIPDDVQSGDGWHWDPRGWVSIDKEGAVFKNYIVKGTVDVVADNVTIDNVRVYSSGYFGIAIRSADNTTINRCMVGPAPGEPRVEAAIKDVYADSANTKVYRCNLYGWATGVQIYRGTIAHNYIHDPIYVNGDHTNGTTSNGFTEQLNIVHNTVFNHLTQTDAISLFQDFGLEANRTIANNLMAGGGYSLYAGQNSGAPATYNIKVYNNRFSRIYFTRGGYYGPATAHNSSGAGNVWSNNIWDDTGAPVYP